MSVELKKAQSDVIMLQSVNKLKQSMIDMKDREIARARDSLKEMQKAAAAAQGSQEKGDGVEELRAKVHSLAYLN